MVDVTDHYAPREGWVPKLRFGPSILDKAAQCPRAYALQYLCGYDTQEPIWAEIADHTYDKDRRVYVAPAGYVGPWETVPSRKRSTALGTECHARVEAHYEGRPEEPGRPRWLDFPGQVAQAWLDVMPKPHECDQVYTELGVALWGEDPGIVLEGTSDLLLKVRRADANRLGWSSSWTDLLQGANGYLVGDWKTTRSWRYQKKAAELYTSRQGVIYPLAAMRRFDLLIIPGRWAYSITDPNKRREARATDFLQTREHSHVRAAEYFAEVRALRAVGERFLALTDGGGAGPIAEQRLAFVQSEYTANTSACDDYGGCPHSWERGGACTARRTIGSRIMAAGACITPDVPLESLLRNSLTTEKGKTKMTSPWAAKAAQLRARTTAAPEASPPVDPATGLFATEAADAGALDPQPEAPSPSVPEPAPKARKGRPPGSKNRTSHGVDSPAALRVQSSALISRETAAELLNTPPPPGVSPAAAMKVVEALADEGEDDMAAERTAEEYVTGRSVSAPVKGADEITLREIARAAREAGCDITIYFPAVAS